ncbi:hypothetical protein Nepgr_015985 [Nepenthes gracilis]|uniref:Disease resistance N-terminal domain-containing protein n=1 Tax=Nepenthes gracilis TaxID=150966 RepID=A0AAD3XRM0_NEPGR|nr:hypothetical protein Nepgr_015985 [Nepenthes gracilis]
MVDAIVTSAAKWISSQLVDEVKFLYGVEDQLHNLQNDLECMQQYLQDIEETQLDEKGNGQVAIFVKTIREIAFCTEDVIDTYILKVGSDSKFTRILRPDMSYGTSIHQLADDDNVLEKVNSGE